MPPFSGSVHYPRYSENCRIDQLVGRVLNRGLSVNQPVGRIFHMREQILDAAESLVQSRGLNTVTFQDIADAVGLKKPSIFHHIKDREELALALIERCSTKHGPEYAAVIEKNLSAPEKLNQISKIFEDGIKTGRPCLLAAIGGGRETLSPTASSELQKVADAAVGRFAMIFTQGRKEGTLTFEGTPDAAATGFFAMLQGLQMLTRVKNDPRAFKKAASVFISSPVPETYTLRSAKSGINLKTGSAS